MKNLKKRGAAIVWQKLIQAAIGAIVIVTLGMIVAGPLVKDNPLIAKILNYALPRQIDPDQGITYNEFKVSERITVANSLNALSCGINTVALSSKELEDGNGARLDTDYCEQEYTSTQDTIRQLEIAEGNDDKIAQQIALEIAECMKVYKPSENIKILPCAKLAPKNNNNNPIPEIQINDIQSKVWSELKKLKAQKNEGASNIVRSWWPDVLWSNRLNWHVRNQLTSKTYLCIRDNYDVYVTEDTEICGLKEMAECSEDAKLCRQYGSSNVDCKVPNRAATTNTKILDLNKTIAIKQLTEATTRCWKDFRKDDEARKLEKYDNRHCAKFKIPPNLGPEYQITEEEFCIALSKEGSTGDDLTGRGSCSESWWNVFGLVGEQYEWNLGGSIKPANEETYFFICADNIGRNEVFLTQNPNTDCHVKDEENIAHQFSCNVKAFELPQEIKDLSYPEQYINALGDPKYLVYYQKFPYGEELAWKYDPKTWVSITLGIRAGIAIVSAAFPIAKSAIKSAMAGPKIKEAVRLAETLDSAKDLARKNKIMSDIVKLVGSSDEGIAAFLKASASSQAYLAEAFTKQIADDVIAKIAAETASATTKELSEQSIKTIAKELESNLVNLGVTNAKKHADDLAIALTNDGEGLFSVFSSLGDDLAAVAKTGSAKFFNIANSGVKKIGFENFLRNAVIKNFDKSAPEIKEAFKSLNLLKQTNPTLIQTMMNNMAKKTKGAVIALGKDVPECIIAGGTVGLSVVAVVESYGIALPVAYPLAKKSIGLAAPACGDAAIKLWFPLMVGASFLMDKYDSKERKYMPIGANKIGVIQPAAYETEPAIFNTNRAEPYYILMTKDPTQTPNRLFFASPCKADLQITTNYCSCRVKNRDVYYEVIDSRGIPRKQPIERLPDNNKIIDYSRPNWITLNDDEKLAFLRGNNAASKETAQIEGSTINSKYDISSGMSLIITLIKEDPVLYANFIKLLLPNKDVFIEFSDYAKYKLQQQYSIPWFDKTYLDNNIRQFNELYQNIQKLDHTGYNEFITNYIKYLNETNKKRRDVAESCPLTTNDMFIKTKELNICAQKATDDFTYTIGTKQIVIPNWLSLLFFDIIVSYTQSTTKFEDRYESPIILEAILDLRNFKTRTDNICHNEVYFNMIQYDSDRLIFALPLWADYRKSFYDSDEIDCPFYSDLSQINVTQLKKLKQEKNINPSIILETQSKLFYKSDFFNNLAKEASFKLYNYTGNDKNQAVKVCQEIEQQVVPSRLDILDYTYETIPCISVKPENIEKYKKDKWNDGLNYCYSGDNPGIKLTSEILSWTSIVGGIALTLTTGGAAAVIVPAALELGSVAMDYMVEKCHTWPSYQSKGIIKCVFGK